MFYTNKPSYGSTKDDNTFLQALAEGGFQVGELAKLYYPGGHDIDSLHYDESLAATTAQLSKPNVVLYEPALFYDNLFVRVDILSKHGNDVQLIEVKAKSIDSTEENPFWKKRERGLSSTWEPYLLDIAFQTFVVRHAHPEWTVHPKLMLADKSRTATVDGLNQRFLITNNNGRAQATVRAGTLPQHLGEPLLTAIDVSREVEFILNEWFFDDTKSFVETVKYFADAYHRDKKLVTDLGAKCRECEFKVSPAAVATETTGEASFKSGFNECWSTQSGLPATDVENKSPVFNIWNYRDTNKKIQSGVLFIEDLDPGEFVFSPPTDGALSASMRQALQVSKILSRDAEPYVSLAGLRSEFAQWQYPLHMIDFETTMVAIPFYRGRRPYEQVAFQFSHHLVEASGKVSHTAEFINTERGVFPNFHFVRELKKVLSQDNGTVFCYATHENTVLRQIAAQLAESTEPDRAELCAWIDTITDDKSSGVRGERAMVDLCQLVKKYFYHPATGGSNSIKQVLPAVLQSSTHLQEVYSRPIYGVTAGAVGDAAGGIASLNFSNWAWVVRDTSGNIQDPYKLLPQLFDDVSARDMDLLVDGAVADGGAAMTAYARMQFCEMSDAERQRVTASLLRYCELDTLAMVMLYQHWAHQIGWRYTK